MVFGFHFNQQTRQELNYSQENGVVMWQSVQIQEADPASFVALSANYAKDKNHAYYRSTIIPKVDLDTFEVIEDDHAKDKRTVFFRAAPIDLDPSTMHVLDDYIAMDQDKVFYGAIHIPDADPRTFKITKYPGYYRDSLHVYKEYKKIEGADPKTYTIIPGTRFSKDRHSVFFLENKIEGADPKTHEIIPGTLYSKDPHSVFFRMNTIEGADPKTHEIIPDVVDNRYSKDRHNVFLYSGKIDKADPQTFRVITKNIGGKIAKDASLWFFGAESICSTANANNQLLEMLYQQDKRQTIHKSSITTNQDGMIQIQDGNPGTVRMHGTMLFMAWGFGYGSAQTLFVHSGIPDEEANLHVQNIRGFVAGDWLPFTQKDITHNEIALKCESALESILPLFEKGTYEYALEECYIDEYNSRYFCSIENGRANGYYSGYDLFVTIQKEEDLSREIIDAYKEKILQGVLPIAIAIGLQAGKYVIDGHHKLQAYKELHINPRVLVLSKTPQDASRVAPEIAREFVLKHAPDVIGDLEVMEKYSRN